MSTSKKSNAEAMQKFESSCKEFGLNITPQRMAIYQELIASEEHPSAVTIFNKIRTYYPNISLDTVNRTLLTFHEIGLAKLVEGSGDAKRFDPNLTQHHHFRCLKCGHIVDFQNPDYDLLDIPESLRNRFQITAKIVHLEGICDSCQRKS